MIFIVKYTENKSYMWTVCYGKNGKVIVAVGRILLSCKTKNNNNNSKRKKAEASIWLEPVKFVIPNHYIQMLCSHCNSMTKQRNTAWPESIHECTLDSQRRHHYKEGSQFSWAVTNRLAYSAAFHVLVCN